MQRTTKRLLVGVATAIMTTGSFIEILKFTGIQSAHDLHLFSTPVKFPHWTGIVIAAILYLVTLAFIVYCIASSYKDEARHKQELATQEASHKQELAKQQAICGEAKRITDGEHHSEIVRSMQIRDIALSDSHKAVDRANQLARELEELKKCYYCPPGDLPLTLTPTRVLSMEQSLIVTNKGPRQAFRAQAKLVGKNDEHILTFNLAWDADEATRTLSTEESGKLQIARIWDDRKDLVTYIALREYSGGIMRDTQWNRWSTTKYPDFPPYRFDVLILGDSTECHIERFVLRPGGMGEPGMCMVREEKVETETA